MSNARNARNISTTYQGKRLLITEVDGQCTVSGEAAMALCDECDESDFANTNWDPKAGSFKISRAELEQILPAIRSASIG